MLKRVPNEGMMPALFVTHPSKEVAPVTLVLRHEWRYYLVPRSDGDKQVYVNAQWWMDIVPGIIDVWGSMLSYKILIGFIVSYKKHVRVI